MSEFEFFPTSDQAEVSKGIQGFIDDVTRLTDHLRASDSFDFKKDTYDYALLGQHEYAIPDAVANHLPNLEIIRLNLEHQQVDGITVFHSLTIEFWSAEMSLRVVRQMNEEGEMEGFDAMTPNTDDAVQSFADGEYKSHSLTSVTDEEIEHFLHSAVGQTPDDPIPDDLDAAFKSRAIAHEAELVHESEATEGAIYATYCNDRLANYTYVCEAPDETCAYAVEHAVDKREGPEFYVHALSDAKSHDDMFTPDLQNITHLRSVVQAHFTDAER